MILDQINKENITAMKNKDVVARNIFSVLKNKAMLEEIRKREKGEELCDADMVAILQKTIKELAEEYENYKKANNAQRMQEIDAQKNIVQRFLPQMMSEHEIADVIMSLDDKSIPSVMKHFKANYAGKCDMGLVGKVLKGIQ